MFIRTAIDRVAQFSIISTAWMYCDKLCGFMNIQKDSCPLCLSTTLQKWLESTQITVSPHYIKRWLATRILPHIFSMIAREKELASPERTFKLPTSVRSLNQSWDGLQRMVWSYQWRAWREARITVRHMTDIARLLPIHLPKLQKGYPAMILHKDLSNLLSEFEYILGISAALVPSVNEVSPATWLA